MIRHIIGWTLMLVSAGWLIYLDWSHPDMTSKRLILEYPGEWGAAFLGLIVSIAFLAWANMEKKP